MSNKSPMQVNYKANKNPSSATVVLHGININASIEQTNISSLHATYSTYKKLKEKV